MRAVIQRVKSASVMINNTETRGINQGLLVLLGIHTEDMSEDIDWLISKITQMRIFSDQDDKMNFSVDDINGEILVISQFTLFASTKKGNRPSYLNSARPEIAIPLYEAFLLKLRSSYKNRVEVGKFGADMQVELTNDGPVTIIIDSKNKE